MKNFDLAAAKAGAPVCTTFGRKVRILCFDKKGETPVVAAVDFEDHENEYAFDEDGTSPYLPRLALMMRDDNYAEKLARGEYGPTVKENLTVENPTCKESLPVENSVVKENLTTDREYWRRVYAGQAMQGLISGYLASGSCFDGDKRIPGIVAESSVMIADALIAELEKTKK